MSVPERVLIPSEGTHVAYNDASTVQRWMALDLWMALGRDCEGFFVQCQCDSWADLWSELLASIRRKR